MSYSVHFVHFVLFFWLFQKSQELKKKKGAAKWKKQSYLNGSTSKLVFIQDCAQAVSS